jgi:mannobiose 2-epimerase
MSNELRGRIEKELTGNILPSWVERTPDPIHGGFYSALSNDLNIDHHVPRSAVLYARILWTFAQAFDIYKRPDYLATARRAYDYIRSHFWDADHGGVYWTVDINGEPLESRKHTYAQAFAIYGLVQYYSATGDAGALDLACRTFDLLEAHAHDAQYGGYVEGHGRDWSAAADMRLSALEPVCDKSMNTLLHTMEAYANLLHAWEEPRVRTRLGELIDVFLDHILDPQTHHFHQFFHEDWTWDQPEPYSYGHDIEGSWLLLEAAERLGDARLLQHIRAEAVQMAETVYTEALQPDGRLIYESLKSADGNDLHWWAHAEAMVGFYNAYQVSGLAHFTEAASRIWNFIEQKFSDHQNGDWFKALDPLGKPYPHSRKVSPWECPYHHSRACFEMIRRLS